MNTLNFLRDMEKEMEAKLREKFMLIDKTDAAQIAAAQQVNCVNYEKAIDVRLLTSKKEVSVLKCS